MGNDQESFNRWEAGQKLFTRTLLANVEAAKAGKPMAVSPKVVEAVAKTLQSSVDKSLKAYALTMPSLTTVAEEMASIDPEALVDAARFTKRTIATALRGSLEQTYRANTLPAEPFRNDQEAIGMRRLKNVCLDYLASIEDEAVTALCLRQVREAGCMTDVVAATAVLASSLSAAARDEALTLFYEKHARGNDLILCKWFTIQAVADVSSCLDRVNALLSHPDFSLKNPNKSRSLVNAFSMNMRHFHKADGSGYRWLADRILEVDKINPQNAARMTSALSTFRRYDVPRQALIREQLERLLATPGFSKDAYEIVSRSLKG